MSNQQNMMPEPEHVSPTDQTVPNVFPPFAFATPLSPNAAVTQPAPPSWPPAEPQFRRRETFPVGLFVLIVVLAIALIGGGLSFIVYTTTVQYRSTVHSDATSFVRSTIHAQASTQAKAQATANIYATANANIYATATAQLGATATLTSQANDATSTATAYGDILTQVTGGTADLNDPLSDNSGGNQWDQTSSTANSECIFTSNSTYEAIDNQNGYFQPCIAEATNFSNMAYQVQMTNDAGGQGGIVFCANSARQSFYLFRIGADGSYFLDRYTSSAQAKTLINGYSAAIMTGLSQANTLAVIVYNGTIYLYANQSFITSVNDKTLTSGQIGVAAIDTRLPSQEEFSNAEVWKISTLPSATPQPSPTAGPSPTVSPGATASPTPTVSPTPGATSTSTP